MTHEIGKYSIVYARRPYTWLGPCTFKDRILYCLLDIPEINSNYFLKSRTRTWFFAFTFVRPCPWTRSGQWHQKSKRGHGRGHGHRNIFFRGHGHGRGHEIIWNGGHGRGHGHKIFQNSRTVHFKPIWTVLFGPWPSIFLVRNSVEIQSNLTLEGFVFFLFELRCLRVFLFRVFLFRIWNSDFFEKWVWIY